MKPGPAALQDALEPLWCFFAATVAGIACTLPLSISAPRGATAALAAVGCVALAAGLVTHDWRRVVLLLTAGAALGGWAGFREGSSRNRLEGLTVPGGQTTLRIEASVVDGWTASRWGRQSRIRIHRSTHAGTEVDLPRICRLEVRNVQRPSQLPPPGTRFEALADLRGTPDRPLLVTSSPSVMKATRSPEGVAAVRAALTATTLRAAGTDADRIRAAELAAALALGRRDVMPKHRVRGWRDSGLGHALAVSGLHVGVVAGTLWLIGIAVRLRPRTIRWCLLALIPGYTVLAGAAPSAVRACLMLGLYLGARLAGRSAVALGTVLCAACFMILLDPSLLFQAGFQLTIGVTAALVRWAPPLIKRLRGPLWLRTAVAVPVIAQCAATPIIAIHFHRTTVTSAVVNLAVPVLLAPLIPLAVIAVAASLAVPPVAGAVLSLISTVSHLLWAVGGLGRHWTTTLGDVPPGVIVTAAVAGLLAIRCDRWSRWAAGAWIALLVAMPVVWSIGGLRPGNRVELLPVGDGMSVLLEAGGDCVLFDGGRFRDEAARLLAGWAPRRIGAVFVSHPDEDHAGGIGSVLHDYEVGQFAYPAWMGADENIVPLVRLARSRGTRLRPVVRGSTLDVGNISLTVVWPPPETPLTSDNERSLVVKAAIGGKTVLLTADIPATVERSLARSTRIESAVLTIPHHGSASSTSSPFLEAVQPVVALIPAGPGNLHGHPHSSVLRRLDASGILTLYPARDGRCGVSWDGEGPLHTYTMAR